MAITGISFFNGVLTDFTQSYGFSESTILMQATTLPAAVIDLRTLVQARVQMLGGGVINSYNRVSKTDVRNDSQVFAGLTPVMIQAPITGAPPPGTVTVPIYNRRFENIADLPGTTIMCRAEGADDSYIARRSINLFGNPDFTDTISNSPRDDANWLRAFGDWRRIITNGKYGFMAIDRSGTNPLRAITGVAATNPTVISVPGLTAVKGDVLILSGIEGDAGRFTGNVVVTDVTGASFTLDRDLGIGDHYRGQGQARRKVKKPFAYTDIIFRRYGSHRIGRPFDIAKGRSKKRAC